MRKRTTPVAARPPPTPSITLPVLA
jgi:hypothetical protein